MPHVLEATAELVAYADLAPHPRNYNHGDVDAVRESIRTNGFYGKIVRQASTGYIIAGHTRALAAHLEGIDPLPVDTYDVDDQTALRILANDNRSAERATRDQAALVDLLELVAADAGDLVGTGYDLDDLADMGAALEAASYAPPASEPREDRVTGDEDNRKSFQANAERNNAARRVLVLDLPVNQFAWLIDALAQVCATEQLPTNTEAVMLLVGRATGRDVPAADE